MSSISGVVVSVPTGQPVHRISGNGKVGWPEGTLTTNNNDFCSLCVCLFVLVIPGTGV